MTNTTPSARLLLVAALLITPALAPAAGDDDIVYSGKWTVRWLSNDSRNAMTLRHSGDRFTGEYTSDDGEVCPVSGSYQRGTRGIDLHIECEEWDIKMNGYGSADGTLMAGNYLAYGDSTGGYTVTKKPPAK